MNSKLIELYDYMDFLRELWEGESSKNPRNADILISIKKEVNETYKQIEVFKRFKTTYI